MLPSTPQIEYPEKVMNSMLLNGQAPALEMLYNGNKKGCMTFYTFHSIITVVKVQSISAMLRVCIDNYQPISVTSFQFLIVFLN